MLVRAIGASLILVVMVWLITASLPAIASTVSGVRTDPASETGLMCTTGVGETSCTLTLAAEHGWADTSDMTVTETSPGSADRTAQTTVQSDRTMILVSGLSPSTSYTFTVQYVVVAAGISAELAGLLQFTPFIVGFGGLVVVVAAVIVGFAVYVSIRKRG